MSKMTYDQYLRDLRIKRLESRVSDRRGPVRWPEVWATKKDVK